MVTVAHRAPVNNYVADWMREHNLKAAGRWVDPDPEPVDEVEAYAVEDTDALAADAVSRVITRTAEKAAESRAILLDVTGMDVEVPETVDWYQPSAEAPTRTMDAPQRPVEPEPAPEPTREPDSVWRAARGIVRKDPTRLPPSRTTAGRRKAHITKMAAQWDVTFEEAEARIPKRPGATRKARTRL